jgi:O-antigen/teichoic acid export membrane protein
MTIDRQRLTVMVRLVECAILGAMLAVLLPRMGAQGAALAVLVASMGGFVMRAAAVRRHLK